jgi:ABC-type transport system substrate-binding protein
MKRMKILTLMSAFAILFIMASSQTAVAAPVQTTDKWSSDFRPHGAYVDEVTFVIYPSTEIAQAMLALQDGTIDAFDERVQTDYVPTLVNDEDIDVKYVPANVYRQLSFNCQLFPANITAFRRAIAFGMDKYQINSEAIGGAGQPLDSYIPLTATEWSVEDTLPSYFYDPDFTAGNASLEAAGFIDLDGDGWREYDTDGSGDWSAGDLDDYQGAGLPTEIPDFAMGATAGFEPAIIAATVAAEGLEEMGIHASVYEQDFTTLLDEFELGNAYCVCFSWVIGTANPGNILKDAFRTGEWLADNFYRLHNETINEEIDKIYESKTIEEAKAQTIIVANLLAYEQPMIVCYNDALIDAYRTDKFEGHMLARGQGIVNGDNPYVVTKVHLIDDMWGGGEFRYCMSEDLEARNPIVVSEGYTQMVFGYVWESLWQVDPDTWDPIPNLAYDWSVEEATDPDEGWNITKYTFNIYENATWHDGTPVTSEDVAYSYLKIWPESPEVSLDVLDVYKVETPDANTAVLWANKTGYFTFVQSTGATIFPKDVWEPHENDTGGFELYQPTDAEMIGSGPYKWNEYVTGEYINLKRHDDWHFKAMKPAETTTTTVPGDTTTTTTTEEEDGGGAPGFELIPVIAAIGITVVFVSRRRR